MYLYLLRDYQPLYRVFLQLSLTLLIYGVESCFPLLNATPLTLVRLQNLLDLDLVVLPTFNYISELFIPFISYSHVL